MSDLDQTAQQIKKSNIGDRGPRYRPHFLITIDTEGDNLWSAPGKSLRIMLHTWPGFSHSVNHTD